MGLVVGELSETERTEILGHAEQCDHCANQLRELRVLENLLQGPLRDALQDLHPSADTLVDFATSRKEEVPREDTSLERSTKKKDLSAQEIERISRHIENCPRCSEETKLAQDATTLAQTPLPLPNRERERLGSHGGSIRRPRSEAEGAGVRVSMPAIRGFLTHWLRPRLLLPLAATAAVAVIAYISLRPQKTRLWALPIVITDQTFSALHGGTGVDLDPLIAQLDAAYSESLDQARRNTRSLDIEAPKTSLVRRGRAGDLVGRPLPGVQPREQKTPSDLTGEGQGGGERLTPAKHHLFLEIQMFIKDRNICSLRSVARRTDGSIVLSIDKPDFNCQEASAEVTRMASNLLRQLDSHETSQ